MAVDTKRKRKPEEYIENIKSAIRIGFAEAEFDVHRVNKYEYRIRVFGNFETMDEIFALTSELQSDILEESGLLIVVLPLGPRQDN